MSEIRVMSFNIANAIDTDDDGENAWAHRAPLNVTTIRRYVPDVIGFQQLDGGNRETYDRELAEYRYVLGPDSDGSYNAIYWNPDRVDLVDSGGFYLSETPDQSSLGWDATYVRAVTWARFRTLSGEDRFLHLNTHYEHIGELARVEGTRLILRKLPELRGDNIPVILTGDFNCNPWSPSYRVHVDTTFTDTCYHLFRAAGFKDTFLEAGGEDSAAAFTFHGFEGMRYWAARHHMAGRIDWILTLDGERRVVTTSYITARDQAPPVYPSDHYPVVAEVVLVQESTRSGR